MTELLAAADDSPADWLVESLTTSAESVLSIVPAGFETYVRVFHPASRRGGASVTWAEIATANGRVAHAGMQLCALTGSYGFESLGQPGVYDHPPRNGVLPRAIAAILAGVLARHTATPERCWFAAWEGWGGLRDEIREAPAFSLPGFRHHLLTGPVAAATETLGAHDWGGQSESASSWWPDDRAWYVATEVDFKTTYLGCSHACADEVLAQDALEAYEIDPATGITWYGDTINPKLPY